MEWVFLFLFIVPLLLNNASCTMFLIKEGVKEVKKIEEERKEKKERQEQQWQREQSSSPFDESPAESPQPRHHGQWTPERED